LTHQNEAEFLRHRDPNERKKMSVVKSLDSRKIIDFQFKKMKNNIKFYVRKIALKSNKMLTRFRC
jgi:hypothetical protein